MDKVVIATSIAAAIAWVPVFRHFWRGWTTRRNPISLSICSLIGFSIYVNISTFFFLRSDVWWVIAVILAGNILVLGNFYLCLHWAKNMFGERKHMNGSKQPTPFSTKQKSPRTGEDSDGGQPLS